MNTIVVINGLPLPAALVQAVENNLWYSPKDPNVWSKVFPQHDCSHPALHSLTEMLRTNAQWVQTGEKSYRDGYLGRAGEGYDPGDIDPTRSLIIGDTEPDCMIALDYRASLDKPCVVVMASDAIRWVRIADDIETFMQRMGLVK